jgi:thiol-disulfide isomerase/thioredoxin
MSRSVLSATPDPAADAAPRRRGRWRRPVLLGTALVAALILLGFREPLRDRLVAAAVLANPAPTPDQVETVIDRARDPRAALLSAWHSDKIVHRQVAIRHVPRVLPHEQPLPPAFETLLLTAAFDPDLNVRQAALSLLQQRRHPALAAVAAAQLRDPDPEVRLLGLRQLRFLPPSVGVPTVVPALADPDPFIITTSLKLLEQWSGEDFGVRLRETTALNHPQTGSLETRAGGAEKASAGAERARAWWRQRQTDFPPVDLEVPADAFTSRRPLPAGNFQLRTLEGNPLRLADLRGRVVLLHFWTTWCPACLSEMPTLVTLQSARTNSLVILGVSLDFVPDSHGHIGGHLAVGETDASDEEHVHHETRTAARRRVREKVARVVTAQKLNYPVLLDERNEVGGRFNGGELPTTVIVDAQGYVRRRFVGTRSLAVLEALVSEAALPASAP